MFLRVLYPPRLARPLLFSLALPLFACGARSVLFDGPVSASDDDAGPAATPSTRAILFGGTVNDGTFSVTADTWQWDGRAWTQLDVSGPPGRYGAAMASFGNGVVLTGGWGPGTLTDTWSWDGTTWKELAEAGPTSRMGAAMAALGDRLVLFGGFGDGPSPYDGSLADTWIWDGSTWTSPGVTGPAARANATMATLDGKVVLFGGSDIQGTGNTYADTWVWDGTSWTALDVPGPPPRDAAVMVPFEGKLFLFGGQCYCPPTRIGVIYSDSWTWDGQAWAELDSAGPAATFASMAEADGKLVLFGGLVPNPSYVDTDATSTWDGTSWTPLSVTGPSARDQAAMATITAR